MINKIRIGCFDYDVVETNEPLIIDGKSDYSGIVNHESNVIKVKENMAQQVKEQILWHEILHCIEAQYELNLGEDKEHIIECFAKGVYQIIRDNEELPGIKRVETSSQYENYIDMSNWNKISYAEKKRLVETINRTWEIESQQIKR